MSATVLANVSCVAIGGRAIIIAGPPGSGKTSLALALIDRGAALVGDDGVTLATAEETLYAAPPPNIAGLIEISNVGLVELPTCEAPVALMLTLDRDAIRFPDHLGIREIAGCAIPSLPFAPGDAVQALRAEYALEKHGLAFPNAVRTATRRDA